MSNTWEEKRNAVRAQVRLLGTLTAPGNGSFEFETDNLSLDGVFLVSKDLSLFEIGSEVDLGLSAGEEELYRGPAVVVRAQKIPESGGTSPVSGYGLYLEKPSVRLNAYLAEHIPSLG